MRNLSKGVLLFVILISVPLATSAQEPNPNFSDELDQETPQQQKQEAQKPDAKASAGDLAKATQNPVASLISVPVQNITDFNIGPFDRDRNAIVQVQPVIPISLGENWNLITRTIGALAFQPDTTQSHGGTFGLGDINPSFFLSPAAPGRLIWGAGPTFLIPTASDDVLGTGKFSIGPTIVALVQPGKWTIGVLINNLWSVAGPRGRPDVNSMTLQYFVNYNLKKGYYVTIQRYRKDHAIGFSACKRRRPGLRQCQVSGYLSVSHMAVEIPDRILVSQKTQRVEINIQRYTRIGRTVKK